MSVFLNIVFVVKFYRSVSCMQNILFLVVIWNTENVIIEFWKKNLSDKFEIKTLIILPVSSYAIWHFFMIYASQIRKWMSFADIFLTLSYINIILATVQSNKM